MFSLAVIHHLNQQAARKARKRGAKPFVPAGPENVENWPPFPFPNLGDFDPPKWVRKSLLTLTNSAKSFPKVRPLYVKPHSA